MRRFLYELIMAWLTLRFLFGWLPMIRSIFDGPSYIWGNDWFGVAIGGQGMTGDFAFLFFYTCIGLLTLWTGWRRLDRIFVPLLLALSLLFLADGLSQLIRDDGDLWFHGDTLNIHLNLAYAAPIASAVMLIVSLIWVRIRQEVKPIALTRLNWLILGVAAAMLPLQYWLLSSGSGQDERDTAGVLLTIAQWIIIGFGMRRYGAAKIATSDPSLHM